MNLFKRFDVIDQLMIAQTSYFASVAVMSGNIPALITLAIIWVLYEHVVRLEAKKGYRDNND